MAKKNTEEDSLRRTVIEPARNGFGINFKELWYYRELIWMLAIREIQLRYRQTILGVAWVILQPLITTVIFTIIFGRLMKTQSDDISYELFAFVGLLPWNVFSQSLQRAGVSLTPRHPPDHQDLFSAHHYPAGKLSFHPGGFSRFAGYPCHPPGTLPIADLIEHIGYSTPALLQYPAIGGSWDHLCGFKCLLS